MLMIRENQIEETALNKFSHIYVGNNLGQDVTLIHKSKVMAPLTSARVEGKPLINEAVITVENPDEEAVERILAKVKSKLETYKV